MKPDLDSVLRAIRAKCLDCSGNQKKLVENCKITDCPLMPYRSIRAMRENAPSNIEKNQLSIFDFEEGQRG